MDWLQVLTIVGANLILIAGCIGTTISLFLWARKEGNEDRREIMNLLKGIQDEMKDFHGRLVAIEERRTKILEK